MGTTLDAKSTPDGCTRCSAFAKFIELGVVSEIPHVPYCTNPLNCIPKADWDPLDLKLRHRLRMLVDQRPINEYLRTQRYRNETLHRARGIIEVGDVALQWDMSSFFYHWPTAPGDREFMECTLGLSGPLGGRWFT